MAKILSSLIALLFVEFAPVHGWARDNPPGSIREIVAADLPTEARATLASIKKGGPFPYPRDGAVFGNFEGRLPAKKRGYYREYTVRTPLSRDRGARRIIAGAGGEYYYTDDHYSTFRLIRQDDP